MDRVTTYIFRKRTLYMLCFIAFMVIDWTRGSQVGSTWAWTVNMTGVVMAVILFSAYQLKDFLKPVYLIYSAAGIAALPLSYYWWTIHQEMIYRDKLLSAVLNVWLLGIFVLKMFFDVFVYRAEKLHFGKLEILAAAMLLWMLFSRNEDIWPLWYLVMFGLFYHTEYGKEEKQALQQGMLDGIIVSFFLLQGAAFIFRPFDSPNERYNGIYGNCNINALFYGIVWVAFLIKLFLVRKENGKKWKEVLCFLFAAIVVAFAVLTVSKTAWIAMFITGIVYIIFADFHELEYKTGKMIRQLLVYFLVAAVCIPVTYGAVRYIPPVFHHPIWYEGEYSEAKVHSFDAWDSEKYVSWEEFSYAISSRIVPLFRLIFGSEQAGISIVHAQEEAGTLALGGEIYSSEDEFTYEYATVTGRLSYWEYYLKNGNLWGHSNTEGHDFMEWIYVWHAQNMFVQFWYYYGIPSAILFLILGIALLIQSIKAVLRKKEGALITLLYLILFGLFGLFEATWYTGEMILLLAFFTPKFLQDEKLEENGETAG